MSTLMVIRSTTQQSAVNYVCHSLGYSSVTNVVTTSLKYKALTELCRLWGIVKSQTGFGGTPYGKGKLWFLSVEDNLSQLLLTLKLDRQSNDGRLVCVLDEVIIDETSRQHAAIYNTVINKAYNDDATDFDNRFNAFKQLHDIKEWQRQTDKPYYEAYMALIEERDGFRRRLKTQKKDYVDNLANDLLTRLPEPKFSEMENPKR